MNFPLITILNMFHRLKCVFMLTHPYRFCYFRCTFPFFLIIVCPMLWPCHTQCTWSCLNLEAMQCQAWLVVGCGKCFSLYRESAQESIDRWTRKQKKTKNPRENNHSARTKWNFTRNIWIMSFVGKWLELEVIILSEISYTKSKKCHGKTKN